MMRGIGGNGSGTGLDTVLDLPPPPPQPPFNRPRLEGLAPLTRVSQSSPHLNVPHFVHGQDQQHVSSLKKVLSELMEVDAALNTPFSRSQSNLNKSNERPVAVDDAALSSGYLKADSESRHNASGTLVPSPIRKSSSTSNVDWSAIQKLQQQEASSSSIQQYTPSFHIGSSKLAMSSSAPQGSSLAMAAQSFPARGQIGSSTTASLGSNSVTSSPDNTVDARAINSHNHTGVLGVFGRGFFAKPVIRSEEENYRYLMALDR